jgi:hypothetical protein
MPGPADPERLAANVAASDERDAPRSLKDVEDEVHRRSGGDEPEERSAADQPSQSLDTSHNGQAEKKGDFE